MGLIPWWMPYAGFSTGITLAAVAIFQLYRTRKIRRSELINCLMQRWDSELLIKARSIVNKTGSNLKDKIEKTDNENSPELFLIFSIPNFFDTLGAMVEHGDLPEKIVMDLFGPPLRTYWNLYKDALTVGQLEGISRFEKLGNKALKKK